MNTFSKKLRKSILKDIDSEQAYVYVIKFYDPTEFLEEKANERATQYGMIIYLVVGQIYHIDEDAISVLSLWQDDLQREEFPQKQRGMVLPLGAIISIARMRLEQILYGDEE